MAPPEARYDEDGRLVLLAKALGLCLVRHPGALPFVMRAKHWLLLPARPPTQEQIAQLRYDAYQRRDRFMRGMGGGSGI